MEWRAVIARAVPLFRYADLVRLQTNPVKEKLFRLRQRLQEHYNALGQESVVEQAIKLSKNAQHFLDFISTQINDKE